MTNSQWRHTASNQQSVWTLTFAGMSAMAVSCGLGLYAYGLFVPDFEQQFSLSPDRIGLIASGAYGAYLVSVLITGFISAYIRPKRFVIFGCLTTATGNSLVAYSPNWLILALGIWISATSPAWVWAPFSDIVSTTIQRRKQDSSRAIITSGLSLGIFISAGVAWLSTEVNWIGWRTVWLVFALISLLPLLFNYLLVSDVGNAKNKKTTRNSTHKSWPSFFCPAGIALLSAAFGYGFISAVYWTYSIDRITSTDAISTEVQPVFWLLIAVGGLAGLGTGHAVNLLNLRRTLLSCFGAMGISACLLSMPLSWLAAMFSALLFGVSFSASSSLFMIWSAAVLDVRPAFGFSVLLIFNAAGSIAGPAILGLVAMTWGLANCFAAIVLLTVLLSLLGFTRHVPR